MSEILPPHVGPLTPSHRRGHCQFNPNLDGRNMCNAPATRHFWVGDPAGSDVWTSFACEDHWESAYVLVSPVDWHDCAEPCLVVEGSRWRWSTNERPGFCYHEGLAESVELAAVDLSEVVGA